MNRRGFINALGIGAAALTLDPERLLWVPGSKKLFIPPPQRVIKPAGVWNGCLVTWDDIVEGSEGPIEQFGSNIMRMVQLKPDVRMFGADDAILAGGHGRVWILVQGSAMINAHYETTGRFVEYQLG